MYYTSMSGYGFGDAILVSGKIVKTIFDLNCIEEYEADIVILNWDRRIDRDIPNVAENENYFG